MLSLSLLLFAPGFDQESLFPNQRGFPLNSGLACKHSVHRGTEPLAAPLALPHQRGKRTLLCAVKYPPGLQHPHQLQDYFTSFSEPGYPEGCTSQVVFLLINYTTLPCSIPVLLLDDVLQSMVNHDRKSEGLWSNVHLLYAHIPEGKAMKAAFRLGCEIPVFTRQPWWQEHLMAHRQVYLLPFSLSTSRNQLSACLRSSCGHGNRCVPSCQLFLQRDT